MSTPIFVDTSALYAALASNDLVHAEALAAWERLLEGLRTEHFEAVVHGGIVVESAALVQRRLGMAAARGLLDDMLPLCTTVWIDRELHDAAATALLAAGSREISLVDWTSFVVMRRHGIEQVLTFDGHFADQGFSLFR